MFTQPEMQYWVRNRTSSPRADGNQHILSAIQQVNSDIRNFKGRVDAQGNQMCLPSGFHVLVDLCTSKLLLVDSSCQQECFQEISNTRLKLLPYARIQTTKLHFFW